MEDSDDYELLPREELEQLRREIKSAKKDPKEAAKLDDLIVSVDRLNHSINKLLTILEDAQQDIIQEYQDSKPTEKLGQIIDQNETIAKAIITINDNIKKIKEPSQALQTPPPQQPSLTVQQPNINSGPTTVFAQGPVPQASFNNNPFSSANNPPTLAGMPPPDFNFPADSQQDFLNNLPPLDTPENLKNIPQSEQKRKKILGFI
jgi:hypothetical protein